MDAGKVLAPGDAERIFARMSEYPDYSLYIATSDERVVGTFALLIMDNLAHLGSKSAIIEDFVVSQLYQRKGIGKAMMNFAFDICKSKSCYKMSLSSNLKRSKAHAFYESLGFVKHGYSYLMEIE